MSVVTTKKELKQAIKRGDDEIIVQGELAQEVKNLKRFGKIGAVGATLACIAGAAAMSFPLALAPFTRGKSLKAYHYVIKMAAENPEGTKTWLTPAVVIAAIGGACFSFASMTVVIAMIKDYDEIEAGNDSGYIRMKRNRPKA